jgi:hypothetical protein
MSPIKISNCEEPIAKIQKKSMKSPDETRCFEKGKVEITKVGESSIGRK